MLTPESMILYPLWLW